MTDPRFRVMSPLGFEITPEIEAEASADPTRMPTSLQTPERRARLIADLDSSRVGERHRALAQLAAWDPDVEVASALRPLLESDDLFAAGQAATGLARQRDVTDLPAAMRLLHAMSPADGGSVEAMIVPLRATLALAALAGPEIVEGVKSRARTWRGAGPRRRQTWEHEFDAELDGLLGPAPAAAVPSVAEARPATVESPPVKSPPVESPPAVVEAPPADPAPGTEPERP
jgi:hypothetical protein